MRSNTKYLMHKLFSSLRTMIVLAIVPMLGCSKTIESETGVTTQSNAKVEKDDDEATRKKTSNDSYWAAIDSLQQRFPDSVVYISPGRVLPPGDPDFTLEVQERIDSLRGQQVILVVNVVDVYRVGATYRIVCQNILNHMFILDCNKETADLIIEVAKTDEVFWNGTFAIVAKLKDSKVAYERLRHAEVVYEREESYEDSEAELREEGLYPKVYVTGQSIWAAHIRGFDLNIDWDDILLR